MAIATELVAKQFFNVQAGVPVAVNFPAYETTDVYVYYGKSAVLAVENVDYTVTLGGDFSTFSVTPTVSLINKINGLIAADPNEINRITVRRVLDLLTSVTGDLCRNTTFTSREFERTLMRIQQLSESVSRALTQNAGDVGGETAYVISGLEAGHSLILDDDGVHIVSGPSADAIENAQHYAEQILAAINNFRIVATSDVTMYVDAVYGTDDIYHGNNSGVYAVRSLQQAYYNLATLYDLKGHKAIIQCAGPSSPSGGAVQTLTSPLSIEAGYNTSPALVGARQIVLDLGGSHLNTTNQNAIFLRGGCVWLTVQNGKISVSGTKGNSLEVYDGGNHIELNGNIEFGPNPAGYGKVAATRYGRISTRPGTTGYSVTGGGGAFLQAIIGGRIEFEGVPITITNGIAFDIAFLHADGGGSQIELAAVAWRGGTPTGKLYKTTKNGVINTNAHYGGQSITMPDAGSTVYTTKNFGVELGYVPGTIYGESNEQDGLMTDPGLPTIVTGGGTGALLQPHEDGFLIVLGTASVGTSIEIRMGNRSFWQVFQVQALDPAALPNCRCAWVGATNTEPAHLYVYWDSTEWMATKAIVVKPIM